MIALKKEILGQDIHVEALRAGEDWNVVVYGGCSPHVGSVSLAEYADGEVRLRTLLRKDHKDHIVGEKYARCISMQERCSVCVSCGIHFHNPLPSDLGRIVQCADALLEELCAVISK